MYINLFVCNISHTFLFSSFTGWLKNAQNIRAWAFEYLPTSVITLDHGSFHQMLQDSNLWIVDFYSPWCGPCQVFAPQFANIAQVNDQPELPIQIVYFLNDNT